MTLEKDSFHLEELERVLKSSEFADKPVMKDLLTYLVTEYVEGRSDRIKGITIAVEVFDKGSDFDADRNALVRNAATRLRRLLRNYYLEEGSRDSFRIEIPKGTYTPSISRNKGGKTEPDVRDAALSPRVAVSPLLNLTGREGLDYLALGFCQQLADALTIFDDFRIIGLGRRLDDGEYDLPDGERINGASIDFLVDGNIQATNRYVKVNLRLIDQSDHSTVWADCFEFRNEENDLFQRQEVVTQKIACQIGSEYGQINERRYKSLLDSKPQTLNEQDLLLKYYHHNAVLTEESALDFKQGVFAALEKEPESALLNNFAGDIYGSIYSLDFPGAEEALGKFDHYIEKAYAINPNQQLVRSSLAYKCLVFDDRQRFFSLLNENRGSTAASPLRLGGFALCTCLFGEWDRGKQMVDEIFDHNLHVPGWLHGLVALDHYRRCEYDQALKEANKYQIQGLHWAYIHRIVALSQLGRLKEARSDFQALLESRPNFVARGRHLMSILIKDTNLLEHLLEGFARIGVKID